MRVKSEHGNSAIKRRVSTFTLRTSLAWNSGVQLWWMKPIPPVSWEDKMNWRVCVCVRASYHKNVWAGKRASYLLPWRWPCWPLWRCPWGRRPGESSWWSVWWAPRSDPATKTPGGDVGNVKNPQISQKHFTLTWGLFCDESIRKYIVKL